MSKTTADHLRLVDGDAGRAPSEPPPDPLVGRTIDGRYLIEDVLGEGGMGLVYRARHAVLNKQLAIKVLRPEVSKDEEIITRFRQEAQSASAIGNEHIIDISDFGTLPDSSTYFVMEYLEGMDLTSAIAQARPMPDARVLHIGKQLCTALGAAHQRGIVHRDLKPDNIYLVRRRGDSDFVKVLDFGIAKVGGGTKKLTKAGQVFGTPHYMSPEQCAGSGTDHRTDIYAVGVILYEMTSGRVPFDADTLMGILTKHMYEQPIPPHTLPPPVDVSPPLESVILKCLEKKADARYQTMEEVLQDLERIEQGLTPHAVVNAVDRASAPAERRDPTGAGFELRVGEPAGGAPSKKPLLAVAGGILALACAAAVAITLGLTGEDPPPQPPPEPVVTPPVAAEAPPEPVEEATSADGEMEETGSRETAKVTIRSEPEGAEVWIGDELLGNTPVEVTRPEDDARVELTLRSSGYTEQTVRISSLTAESVRLTLEREQSRSRSRRVRRARPRATRMAEPEPAMAQPSPPPEAPTMQAPPRRTLPQSEVIDPWN